MPPIQPNVAFVTPTFGRDYERFCLQRESMENCGIDIPHVAVVHDEDLAMFRRTPHQKNLTLVSTRDVLPPALEKRRRLWGVRRRDNWRNWFSRKGVHGWMTQQIVKLASPAVAQAEGIVCLDSDVVFVNRVTAADFFDEQGRLHLNETSADLDAEMADWFCRSMKFWGVPLKQQTLRQYIHPLSPMHRQVLLDMHAAIESRYHQPWHQAIIEQNVFEYMTYGVYCRFVDGLKRQVPVAPRLCVYYWWPEQAEQIEADFARRVGQSAAKAVWIQSTMDVPVAEIGRLAAEVRLSRSGMKV
jgi:hypothetical protein